MTLNQGLPVFGPRWGAGSGSSRQLQGWTSLTGSLRGKALRGIDASATVPHPPTPTPQLPASSRRNHSSIGNSGTLYTNLVQCIILIMQAIFIQGSGNPSVRLRGAGIGSTSTPAGLRKSVAPRRSVLRVESFGILKQLGLQKPGWLPDFGKSRRKMLIERFFGPIDRATYEELLSQDFVMRDEQDSTATFTRQGMQTTGRALGRGEGGGG